MNRSSSPLRQIIMAEREADWFVTILHLVAIGLMCYGVYLSPPEIRGVALILASGFWFVKAKD